MGKFDEAVRSAFVLLEERLCKAVDKEGMTGVHLANYAFNAEKGPLSKHLGRTGSEREGLRELYSGAFKLFRNPTAHGVVGYSAPEGKAIIGMVDLMLKLLKRADELSSSDFIPDYVQAALSKMEETLGPGATGRLRFFLDRCVKEARLKPTKAKQWIPFKTHALYKAEQWEEPKAYTVAVFYLVQPAYSLHFSTEQYYANVVGFNVDRLTEELLELGFYLSGKRQEPRIDLRIHNDQPFFDELFTLVVRVADELGETLREE
jgi:uncharacterized protein (TIGR02391 family)